MNDAVNSFGTCEILDEDFHCTHDCSCPKHEIDLVESLQKERDAGGTHPSKEFVVLITQKLVGTVNIKADSKAEAIATAERLYIAEGNELPEMDDSRSLDFEIFLENLEGDR